VYRDERLSQKKMPNKVVRWELMDAKLEKMKDKYKTVIILSFTGHVLIRRVKMDGLIG